MGAPDKAELHIAVQTDVGLVREHNEDSYYVDTEEQFFVVADGMGGHASGEVASAMACDGIRERLEDSRDTLAEYLSNPTEDARRSIIGLLEQSVRHAHEQVYKRGKKEREKEGMGTTLDVLLLIGNEAFVAHVGDSRTYLLREGRLQQLTTDHTMAEVLMIEGKLTEAEAQVSPMRTVLVNAIGVQADVGVEWAHIALQPNDRFLLCSDGLHDYFPSSDELAEHIGEGKMEEVLDRLVEQAKDRGGHDNITGLAIEVVSVPKPVAVKTEKTVKVRANTLEQPAMAQAEFATEEPTDVLESALEDDAADQAVAEFTEDDTVVAKGAAAPQAADWDDATIEAPNLNAMKARLEADKQDVPEGQTDGGADQDDAPKTEVIENVDDDAPKTEVIENEDDDDAPKTEVIEDSDDAPKTEVIENEDDAAPSDSADDDETGPIRGQSGA